MTQVNVTAGRPDYFPENRKSLFMTMGASACTFVTDSDLSNPDSNVLAIPTNNLTVLTASHVDAPISFFGMNSGNAIGTNPDPWSYTYQPLKGLTYGIARSHDARAIDWANIEASAGVYRYDNFDRWAATQKNNGQELLFTVYKTPIFYSSNTSKPSPYGNGYGMPPTDMSKLVNFVTDLASHSVSIGIPIKYWEICNEPNFLGSFAGVGARFWGGTVADLSVMCRLVNQAVKAIIPDAKIISPACTNWDNVNVLVEGSSSTSAPLASDVATTYELAMMAASDGAGGTMKDWIDFVGCHLYGSDSGSYSLVNRINSIKSAMTTAGISGKKPFDTETGITLSTSFSDYRQYADLARYYVTCLAMGFEAACYYQIGRPELSIGYSLSSKPEVVKGLETLFTKLRQFGIDGCTKLTDGRIAFRCNGTEYLI